MNGYAILLKVCPSNISAHDEEMGKNLYIYFDDVIISGKDWLSFRVSRSCLVDAGASWLKAKLRRC